MDEILLFESTGSIEYYPDPENVKEDTPVPEEPKEEDQEEKEEDTENENREVQYIYIKSDPVSTGNDISDSNNNQTVGIVSQNIIDTPLNEYDITNSLLVFMIVMFMGVGIIWLIKRSIFKWN